MRGKTFSRAALAAALLLGFLAMNTAAQVPAGAKAEAVVAQTAADTHIENGDRFLGMKRYGKARAEYRTAAKLMRADGLLPEEPLRRVAISYYLQDKHQRAVSVLDRLAKEAAEVGEVAIQTHALADAVWVFWTDCTQRPCPGAKQVIEKRQRQIERLLSSPYINDAERTQIAVQVGVSPTDVLLAKNKRARMRRS